MKENRSVPRLLVRSCFLSVLRVVYCRIGLLSLLLCLLFVSGGQAFQEPEDRLPNVDRRPAQQAKAGRKQVDIDRLRARLPKAEVEIDDRLQSARWMTARDGFLTGPGGQGGGGPQQMPAKHAGKPRGAILSFVDEHAGLVGHGADAIEKAVTKREFTTTHSGLRTVTWAQHVEGVEVFDALFTAHVTARGELVNLSSLFVPDPARATKGRAKAGRALSAAEAIRVAATNIGEVVTAEPQSIGAAVGASEKQQFTAEPLPGQVDVELTWLPISAEELRLCWKVVLGRRVRGEMFLVLVDADTGEMLIRRGLTEYLSPASYRVFTSDSPTPFSPGHPTPATNQPPLASRVLLSLSALDTNASPNGWINDADNETRGNNVDAHLDGDANNQPDLPRPQGSPSRVFDFAQSLTQSPSTYADASVVQLFYWNNWMHDRLYQLGFTEAAGNFQVDNFGRGGFGGDAVQADAQDGSGFNNANFSTPSDGSSPRMQMYVFTGAEPDRDSALDAEIVLHEYTHGLSNRRVGGGIGLWELQSRGMGEGWSDFYPLALLGESGDDLGGAYAKGAYSTYQMYGLRENYYFGIRRYPCSTNLLKSPLTFKDIDPAQADSHFGVPQSPLGGGPANQVHNQGEVWCVTLWEARALLIAKHGFVEGNERILRLVTDGMNLSPPNPNFVQARDAILQADRVSAGGDRAELWQAFAKRGLGASAFSPPSYTTSGLREAFDIPDPLEVSGGEVIYVRGNVGGPFTPSSYTFTVENAGAASLGWGLGRSAPWLTLSPVNGTLDPGENITVTLSVNSAAAALSQGFYTNVLVFTNITDGTLNRRTVVLRAGPQNYYTELFASGFDLQGHAFTFKPDGSSSVYAACRFYEPYWHTDPTQGTRIYFWDNDYALVTLSGGATVSLYGRRTNAFFIGSNGYITFEKPDSSSVQTLSNHFAVPRISGLLADWHPGVSGSVRWQQLSDRVAVTWLGVPLVGAGGSNSFQIEMFFADGVIRLTYPHVETAAGLVGLSAGLGVPSDYVSTDLSAINCGSSTVDHFGWGAISSPQTANSPFGVFVVAQDVFNLDQTSFAGPVRLTAQQVGVTVYHENFESGLGGFSFGSGSPATDAGLWHLSTGRARNVGHSPSNSLYYGAGEGPSGGGNYDVGPSAGYVTSPRIDLRQVTSPAVLSLNTLIEREWWAEYDQASVEVSADDGQTFAVLASTFGHGQSFPDNTFGAWTNVQLDLSGFAGQEIRLRFRFNVRDYYNRFEGWYVDDIRILGVAAPLALTPTNSGSFANASWSGNVTVQEPAGNAVLIATDSQGHRGVSAPFTVLAPNDLWLVLTAGPAAAHVGQIVVVNARVSNSGPNPATGVIVTNVLPPGTIAQVTSSQGSSTISGRQVITTVGTLGSGGTADVTISFVPTNAAAFTATAMVVRAGADGYAGNNTSFAEFTSGLSVISVLPIGISEATPPFTSSALFAVQLTPASPLPVTVNARTLSGSAAANSDFTPVNTTVTFSPGTTLRYVDVPIVADQVFETNESFVLLLTNAVNAIAQAAPAECAIYDDEPWPVLGVRASNIPEGNSGFQSMPFEFRVYGASSVPLEAAFSTSPWTATAEVDYDSTNGLVNFAPGESNKTVHVRIRGDLLNETNETFFFNVYGTRYVYATNSPVATIIDDDLPLLVLTNYEITAEQCQPPNGGIDPGEMVTVLLTLQNVGFHGTTSTGFTARLLSTNGIASSSQPQVYGMTTNGGPPVSRSFSLMATGLCGTNVTFTLELRDGTTNLGLASLNARLGARALAYAEDFEHATAPFLPVEWGTTAAWGTVDWGTSGIHPDSGTNAAYVADVGWSTLSYLFSPPITLRTDSALLRFRHWFGTEMCCDYGTLWILPPDDGLLEWTEAGGTFLSGGYTPYYSYYYSQGWRGSSGGFVTTLAAFPSNYVGQTVRIVWAMRTDSSVSGLGWWVDSVSVLDGFTCCDSETPYIYSAMREAGQFVLRWSAQSNQTYRIESASSMAPGVTWAPVAGDVIANGHTASKTNTMSTGQRFYRVRRL